MKMKVCQHCNGTGKEPDHKAIGWFYRQFREARNKLQKQVAAAMGLSAAYLSDLELGKRAWSADLISQFKEACK